MEAWNCTEQTAGTRTPEFETTPRTGIGKHQHWPHGAWSPTADQEGIPGAGGASTETPRGNWIAAKIPIDEISIKLRDLLSERRQEGQQQTSPRSPVQRQNVERPLNKPKQKGKAPNPMPVGLVLPEPLKAPLARLEFDWGPASALVPPPAAHPEPRPKMSSQLVISLGTVGHPNACGAPCSASPCLAGQMCRSCHLCEDSRQTTEVSPAGGACASVGSMGHPTSCADACKFATKPKGCKDGALCVRCHSCRWRRSSLLVLFGRRRCGGGDKQ